MCEMETIHFGIHGTSTRLTILVCPTGCELSDAEKSKLCLYDLACKSWAHFLSDFLSLVGGEGSIPSLPSISQHKFHFLIRYNYDKARS